MHNLAEKLIVQYGKHAQPCYEATHSLQAVRGGNIAEKLHTAHNAEKQSERRFKPGTSCLLAFRKELAAAV